MQTNTFINRALSIALAGVFAVALMFTAASVRADGMDFGWIADSYMDTSSPFFEDSFGGWYPESYVDTAPAFNDYGGWYPESYVDTAYPSYDYGYYGGSTMGGFGGFSMPFSTMGGSAGGNRQSQSQSQGQSQSQSSTNTNVNNNVITISQPVAQANPVYPTPVCPVGTTGIYPNCIYPQQPQLDICPNLPGIQSTLPSGYYIQNGNCFYQNYVQPNYPVYQQPVQPYVTLSQVPYTGLEMGPMATAMYWGFLVLWCLVAAYLIVVKKVQNKIAAWFVGGSTPSHTVHVAHAAPAPKATVAPAHSGIDPFIQSQINRFTK